MLWFTDKLLISRGAFLPEAVFSMKEKAWELISKRIGKEEIEVMERVEQITNKLSNGSRRSGAVTINWAEIVRPPW